MADRKNQKTTTPETKEIGRPSKFNELIKEKIISLAKDGKTNEQIADIIGVHVRTIENWQGKHKDLLWALREAKQAADDLVEASLFSRAVGYSHKSVKVFFDRESLQTVEHEIVEQYPPDVTAAIFWLKNRKPSEWREKTEVEHSGKIESLSDEDLDAKINEKISKLNEPK